MRKAALSVREQLLRQPPPLPAAVVAESAALLEYMEDNHFTFLGFRRTRLRRRANGPHLEAIPGSALGIMRTRPPGDLVPLRAKRELVVVTKANRRSTVHRPGYLDYVVVKEFDRRGRITGEAQFLGLWTSNTYHADPRTVPLMRLKVARVIEAFPFRPSSHDSKRLVSILDNLPRDELFQASIAELTRCARAVLALHDQPRGVCLVLRRDELRRFWSCLVYLARDRLDNNALDRIGHVLRRALGGGQLDSALAVGDAPLAQLHITVRITDANAPTVNRRALERELDATLVTWRDRLRIALRACHDEASGRRNWTGATHRRSRRPISRMFHRPWPFRDIADLATPAAMGAGRLRLQPPKTAGQSHAHLRLLRHREPLPISDALPILESFGLRVIAERPYELRPSEGGAVWIQDFELETPGLHEADAHALETQLNIAYTAVLAGALDSDGFHRLDRQRGTDGGANTSAARLLPLPPADGHSLQPGLHGARPALALAHCARPVAAV